VFVSGKANSGMVGPSFCTWAVRVALNYCGLWYDSLWGDSMLGDKGHSFLHITGLVARCVRRQENMERRSFLTLRFSRKEPTECFRDV
jgi:hypothetical protein